MQLEQARHTSLNNSQETIRNTHKSLPTKAHQVDLEYTRDPMNLKLSAKLYWLHVTFALSHIQTQAFYLPARRDPFWQDCWFLSSLLMSLHHLYLPPPFTIVALVAQPCCTVILWINSEVTFLIIITIISASTKKCEWTVLDWQKKTNVWKSPEWLPRNLAIPITVVINETIMLLDKEFVIASNLLILAFPAYVAFKLWFWLIRMQLN